MDKHDLICLVKDLAIRLGRTPYRDELLKEGRGLKEQIYKQFGTYGMLMAAAGIEPARRDKITNDIFKVDIDRHLEEYSPRERLEKKPYPKIAVLGDIHEPFSHENTKADFVSFCGSFQPEYIVQIGDAMDMYSNSKFPRSHNIFTPKEEQDRARKNLEELWASLQRQAPKAKCVQLIGNHEMRVIKRVLEHLPAIEHWAEKYLKELMTFDGVELVSDPREEYLIAEIAFIHGYRGGYGVHSDHIMRNVVCGHLHKGSVIYRSYKNQTLWELNAGVCGDPEAKGLTYTPTKTTGWTLGWAAIDEWGPRFISR